MKKYFFYAAAAIALASCSNNEFFGDSPTAVGKGHGEISFSSRSSNITRADFTGSQAAEKLNYNFIVYGFKTNAAEAVDGTTDQMVFNLYNVNYTAGTANTTESNTADWEYVGLANHDGSVNPQTIKYWDYSANDYVYSAVSGTGITAKKVEKAVSGSGLSFASGTLTVNGTASVYDKGWEVTIPAGGSLADLYASERVPVVKANYGQQVNLKFYNLATKIRFAMYETVPGYTVHIDKFYYDNASWKNTETNFAINGTFKTPNAGAETPLTITYYESPAEIQNRPKVSYNDGEVTVGEYGVFGANMQATEAIGTNSIEATYDQSDKSYTMVLPYESSKLSPAKENVLKLYVDYTLTSTDGSNEEIKVKHASAMVPTNFNQWKPNFAYTYIFKISDNTNGTTGDPNDPNDPTSTPTDPTGLYPITFDALVIDSEDGLQETITSVSEPTITTYAKGKIVTENDEYTAGTVYYTIMNTGVLMNTAGGVSKVYEVNNYGDIEKKVTEEVVANYLNNFCVLTEVSVDFADNVPLSDNTNLTFDHGKCLKFEAQAGKTYAIMYDYNNGAGWKKAWKVVKVDGTKTAPTFSLAQTDGSNPITTVAGKTVLTLKQGTVGVLGAKPNFKITSTNGNKGLVITPTATDGVYDVTVDPAAIYAGKANDTYTVDFQGETVDITVNIANALSATAVTVTAGNATGTTTTFTIAGALSDDGVIVNENKGINIEAQGSGVYKVTADADVAYKAAGYAATIGGVALTINVDSYAFLSDLVITKDITTTNTGILTLQKNGAAATGTHTLTGADGATATHTETDGVYTFSAVAGGSFNVTYENATAKITVNEYSLVKNNDIINASTGSSTLTLKLQNSSAAAHVVNALASKVTVEAYDGVNPTPIASPNYTLTTNGQNLIFRAVTKGNYQFTYIEDGCVVAQTQIRVQ